MPKSNLAFRQKMFFFAYPFAPKLKPLTNMNKKLNFITGFVTGAVVGSAVSLLLAPVDGKYTRDILGYQLSRLKDLLKSLIQRKEELVNEAKSQGEANVTKTQLEARKLQDDIERMQKRIKNKEA